MNLRFFEASPAGGPAAWWFGGGFDLTPYYGFDEDCVHWHEVTRRACAPLGRDAYPRFKKRLRRLLLPAATAASRAASAASSSTTSPSPASPTVFAFAKAVGDAYLDAYLPIVRRRKATPFGRARARAGSSCAAAATSSSTSSTTAARSTASSRAAASSPCWPRCRPSSRGTTTAHPEPGSPEAELLERYLPPREWVG